MPFRRPTLSDLRLRARALFASKLKGADGTLPKSNITVSSDVMAALTYGVYGYADWLARQALPNTADDWNFLLRWGALFGLTPLTATTAGGNALFTGTTGTSVPLNTKLQDGNARLYKTTAAATLVAGSTSIPVVALDGGTQGNLAPGAPLTLQTAITGVNGSATVDGSGLSGGTDAETAQAFGARIASRVKNPPAGSGTVADYERWALGVPGVTRAKATGLARGPGTVDIRFVRDNDPDGIIPSNDDIDDVQAAIDALKPLTDDAQVLDTLTTQTVNYQLSASLVKDKDRPAIAASLAAMHARLVIGTGLSFQGQMIPAITSAAQGLTGTFLTLPNGDVPADPDVVLTLGTITYL
jgi:uncharacterized phage protein gp47/JayE